MSVPSFLTNQNAFFKKSVVWIGLISITFEMSFFKLKINFTQKNLNKSKFKFKQKPCLVCNPSSPTNE